MASNVIESDIRILLIGRTGHGKSSTGNTIVGRKVFTVCSASTSETKTCKWSKKCSRLGRTIEVVDTPGMFDTDQSNTNVHRELLKSLVLCMPGFHAIAFVLKPDKFTEELQKTQDLFFEWFGNDVERFACVILTNTDSEQAKDEYLNNKPHHKLTELVQKCNNIVIPLNNDAVSDKTTCQVEFLFQAVEKIKKNNGNKCFSNLTFKLAHAYAMNKYPKQLTNESIHILQDAGLKLELTRQRCHYLDNVYDRIDSSISESKSSASGAELKEETTERASQQPGNLVIIDDLSNEQISNTVVKNKMKTDGPKRNVNENENGRGCMETIYSRQGEHDVPVLRSTNGSINSFPVENEIDYGPADIHESGSDQIDIDPYGPVGQTPDRPVPHIQRTTCDEQTEKNAEHARRHQHSDGQSRKQPGSTRNSRKDRIIDIDTVQYDREDEFKDRVNNDDTELNGFFYYIKTALQYCKKKIKCTLL